MTWQVHTVNWPVRWCQMASPSSGSSCEGCTQSVRCALTWRQPLWVGDLCAFTLQQQPPPRGQSSSSSLPMPFGRLQRSPSLAGVPRRGACCLRAGQSMSASGRRMAKHISCTVLPKASMHPWLYDRLLMLGAITTHRRRKPTQMLVPEGSSDGGAGRRSVRASQTNRQARQCR